MKALGVGHTSSLSAGWSSWALSNTCGLQLLLLALVPPVLQVRCQLPHVYDLTWFGAPTDPDGQAISNYFAEKLSPNPVQKISSSASIQPNTFLKSKHIIQLCRSWLSPVFSPLAGLNVTMAPCQNHEVLGLLRKLVSV